MFKYLIYFCLFVAVVFYMLANGTCSKLLVNKLFENPAVMKIKGITSNLYKIENGMTYQEGIKIMGREADEYNTWSNPPGCFIYRSPLLLNKKSGAVLANEPFDIGKICTEGKGKVVSLQIF